MKRLKITDVARKAGVSASTVDRVLNKRPGVRQKTVEKVNETLALLGYSSTQLASMTNGGSLNFVALIPEGKNQFMGKLALHLQRAGDEHAAAGVTIDVRRADMCSVENYVSTLLGLLEEKPDGVVLVPIDTAETRDAIDDLVAAGIQVGTVASDVPQSARAYYVGVDNVSAGRTAGSLLAKFTRKTTGTVGVVIGFQSLRDHQERRAGLEQALGAACPEFNIITSRPSCNLSERTEAIVQEMIANTPDLIGIYNVGGGNTGLAKALESTGRKDLTVIGHELTTRTRKNLVAGLYDAIIAQDYWVECDLAIKGLISVCRGERDHEKLPPISIDIFIKDNLP